MQTHGAFDNSRHGKPAAARETRYLYLMVLALLAIVLTWTWMKTDRKLAEPEKQTRRESINKAQKAQAPQNPLRQQALQRKRLDERTRLAVLKGAAEKLPGDVALTPAQPTSQDAGDAPAGADGEESWAQEMRAEAQAKEKFIPPAPNFTRVEQLDQDILYKVWDVDQHGMSHPDLAHQLPKEREVFAHVFAYLRSRTKAQLLSPKFKGGRVEGLAAHEMPIYNALSDQPKTADQIAREANASDAGKMRAALKRFQQVDLATAVEARFRLKVRQEVALTQPGRLAYEVLTPQAATAAQLAPRVRKRVEALPTPYQKGIRRSDKLQDLPAAVVAELTKSKKLTDAQLAETLGITRAQLTPVLLELTRSGHVVPLPYEKPWLSAQELRTELNDLARLGLAEVLPPRFVRGSARVAAVPQDMEEIYFIIRRSDETSVHFLTEALGLPLDQLRPKLAALTQQKLIARSPLPLITELMRNPEAHRGKVVRFQGFYLRKYKLYEWPENESGVRHTWLVFMTDLEGLKHTYAVLAMEDTDDLERADFQRIELTGVFIKIWPALVEGRWKLFPLLVAKEIRRFPKPDSGLGPLLWIVGVVIVVGGLLIYFGARRDSAQGRAYKERLLARQRANRERFKQKAKAAGVDILAKGNSGDPRPTDATDDDTTDSTSDKPPPASEPLSPLS